ncbi:MAG: DUF1501 domain-containing protein [Candidatus Hydrogenedentes bacterium]|nr:DUF1501 domain-containing protein [Candidatus Hydrogenedentota bacterium]
MLNQGYVNGNPDWQQTLLVVFLRGGADGLNMVPPVEDDAYYRGRPFIHVPKDETTVLDDLFGLHPALGPLQEIYRAGELAIIHGVGSEDSTRSHFEAQDLMEHGGAAAGGWLGRYLRYRPGPEPGPLAAITIGKALPESLRGAPSSVALESLRDLPGGTESSTFLREIERLYARESGPLRTAASSTLAAIARLTELRGQDYRPADEAVYPNDEFGRGLRQTAQLIKARVGLEAACIDLGGWDSHFAQANLVEPRLRSLANGLRGFWRDLGPDRNKTTVVVMTEFGRRVYENASLGTDHGRGGAMFILGEGIHGGRVFSKWMGLNPEQLEPPGDVPVAYNYRDVLAPLLQKMSGMTDFRHVFPDFTVSPLPLYS